MNKNIRSFKESIRYFFFRYALIPIFILFILFSIFIVLITKMNIIINSKQAGKNINNQISEVYSNYSKELDRMSSSTNVTNFIDSRLHSNLVYDEYYKFINTQKVKGVLSIIDTRGIFLISTSNSDSNTQRSILSNIVPKLKKNSNEVLSEINILPYEYNKQTTYTFGKAISDNGTVVGYLVYQLYEEDFETLLFQQNNELAVITDNHNRIIATNNNSIKGLMNKFTPKYYSTNDSNYVDISNNKYYIYKNEVINAPIYIYTMNSMSIRNDIFWIYFTFVLLVSILLLILIHHLGNRMSLNNSKSIDKLIYSVNELKQGNLNSYVNINSGDEFELLANEFNIMLDTLNDLMKKNKELLTLSYMSEIKLLESQFNPHFIFNVLETLKYSIVIAPNECEKIIVGLSRLLRYSINYENQKVELNKDLDYIKDYLDLNKFRFKEKLKYTIEISNNAEKALIPKLLLQTIVENSIKYGYKDKENLEINITANIIDKKLILEVKDNGSGMTPEQLNNIKDILKSTDNTSNHIGLHNAYKRLILLYGDNQSFQIESMLGVGTTIELTMPYEEENLYV